jgi:RHS repeat-associated protein
VAAKNRCTPVFGTGVSRARYFNPGTGRFWTADTYEGEQEDPLSLHKYLYCAADPLNNSDPSGRNAHLFREWYGDSPRFGKPGHSVLVVDNPDGGVEVFGFHSLSWDLQNEYDQGPYVRFFFIDTGYVKQRHFDSVETYVKSEQAQEHGVTLARFALGTTGDDRSMISTIQDMARHPLVYSIAFQHTCHELADQWFEMYLHGNWNTYPVQWKSNSLLPLWALPGMIYVNPGVTGIDTLL